MTVSSIDHQANGAFVTELCMMLYHFLPAFLLSSGEGGNGS